MDNLRKNIVLALLDLFRGLTRDEIMESIHDEFSNIIDVNERMCVK